MAEMTFNERWRGGGDTPSPGPVRGRGGGGGAGPAGLRRPRPGKFRGVFGALSPPAAHPPPRAAGTEPAGRGRLGTRPRVSPRPSRTPFSPGRDPLRPGRRRADLPHNFLSRSGGRPWGCGEASEGPPRPLSCRTWGPGRPRSAERGAGAAPAAPPLPGTARAQRLPEPRAGGPRPPPCPRSPQRDGSRSRCHLSQGRGSPVAPARPGLGWPRCVPAGRGPAGPGGGS